MSNKIVGIVDEPNPRGHEDTLDINRHASALTSFIKQSTTPMTIGIQGEWGSGKTSLLNAIYHDLDQEGVYKQIWINSWEHALLTTPEESLLKIVNEIIHEMLQTDEKMDRKNDIKNIASTVFKGALRIGATAIAGKEAVDVTDELMGENTNGIKQLREQLNDLAQEIRNRDTNPIEKIVIYVDDLDRIEPKDAVQVLELLKNIFSVPNCVFVLAIDYQVVVKGLEHKFGVRTEENEWEFRAFFDKIIQLPFMMPMGQYNIGKYVSDLLKQIGFIESDDDFDQEIQKVLSHSIGGNPRSLKRLVNSLALIDIFTSIDEEIENNKIGDDNLEDIKQMIMFSLVCLQISFPAVYELLIKQPDFLIWDEDTAFEITGKAEEKDLEKFNKDINLASKTEDFDEDWEKALYRICYPKPRYRSRASDISRFFNYIKEDLLKNHKDQLGNIIAEIIDDTAVTSVSTTDDDMQIKMPKREKGSFKRIEYDSIQTTILSLKEKGISEQQEKDFTSIYNQILEVIPKDSEVRYWEWGISVYAAKHKFLRFQASIKRKPHRVLVLKDHEKDYKYPKIEGVYTNHVRVYKGIDKPSTAGSSEQFEMLIPNLESFNKQKDKILNLINKSYDIAVNHWDKRLRIDIRKGNMSSQIHNIDGDDVEVDKFAKQVLNENYFYDC